MKKIRALVMGKINLSLNILGKKDNLHLIDSVMQSVNIYDTITVMQRLDSKVNIDFIGSDLIDKENNTVKKTVDSLRKQFGNFGVDIVVEKNIPIAGGLGGSSADAAATLLAINSLFDFDKRGLDINKIAIKIGSDVPFMLEGGCARVTKTGEEITKIENYLDLIMVIANKGEGISSGKAYAKFDEIYNDFRLILCDNNKLIKMLSLGDKNAINLFSNALEPASSKLESNILSTKQGLLQQGAISAVMTGSGNNVVGFFESTALAIAAQDALINSGFWAKCCYSTKQGVVLS